jgi:YHS domain-containing protein
MKRLIVLTLVLSLLLSLVTFAETTPTSFTDLPEDHWAYEAVMLMVEKGVFAGYTDGTFKPADKITRAEFAKIMVKVLELPVNENAKSGFVDLADDHWSVPYIDAASKYLTGYQTASGLKYKPDEPAVREDMAVALVMALGLDLESESILTNYKDAGDIADILAPYVATAIENALISGYVNDGVKTFKPKGELTRAEASKLLMNVLNVVEDKKIILGDPKDDVKVPLDKVAVSLEVIDYDGGLKLKWSPATAEDFKYYKIVASKSDSTPAYPDNGYATYKDDVNDWYFKIYDGQNYNGGDIGSFEAGETYYFSITAVYHSGEKITSNVVKKAMPGVKDTDTVKKDITLEIGVSDDDLILEWTPASSSGFKYYKVVASKSDSTPKYPENGYAAYISSVGDTRYELEDGDYYNSGDFSKFVEGQTYYFSITAVYNDGTKITSNVIKKVFPTD